MLYVINMSEELIAPDDLVNYAKFLIGDPEGVDSEYIRGMAELIAMAATAPGADESVIKEDLVAYFGQEE